MKNLVVKSHNRFKSRLNECDNILNQAIDSPSHDSTEEESISETCLIAPRTITHTEDNGARLAETKSLNKLPFMNRNPAI